MIPIVCRNIDACSVYLYLSWNLYLTYFFTARVKKTKQLRTALKKVGLFLLYMYIYKCYLLKSITACIVASSLTKKLKCYCDE